MGNVYFSVLARYQQNSKGWYHVLWVRHFYGATVDNVRRELKSEIHLNQKYNEIPNGNIMLFGSGIHSYGATVDKVQRKWKSEIQNVGHLYRKYLYLSL